MLESEKDIPQLEIPAGAVYFTGASVKDGRVDLEKTVRYLKGLEKALKYHINKVNPDFAAQNYSVEVRLRPGSLVTDIMSLVVASGAVGAVSVGLGAYLKGAGEQLGKNDVGESTSKEVAKDALSAMMTTMKIAKHRGSMMLGKAFKPEETKVIDAENIILVNSKGQELRVTKAQLDLYRETPKNEFRDMTSLIDRDTSMYIGNEPLDQGEIPASAVSINFSEKYVFDDRDDEVDSKLIFPELTQDAVVTLEGELTRGNGRSNTLGFSYSGRILKCVPYGTDSVKDMRDMLFGFVRIKARVDRRSTAKGSEAILIKPFLRIMEIEKLEDEQDEMDSSQASLLTDIYEGEVEG